MRRGPKLASSPPPNLLQLYRSLPFKIGEISTKLTRSASRLYFKHFGVGGLEWRIISMLAIEPNIAANRIVNRIGLNKGVVSRVLKRLHESGHVRVTVVPKKGRLLALTPRGEKLHDRMLVVALERERRLVALLTPKEVDTLLELLGRLEAQLQAVSAYDPVKPK